MTTIEETLTKLVEMRLASMALAVRELMETDPTIADAICDRLVHNAHV